MLPDRVFYPLAALAAALLVAFAMVWPLGQGAQTPSLPASIQSALPAQ